MGNLIVYTGPMKCGKTKKLISTYNEVKEQNPKTLMFKPTIDDRFNKIGVVSRDGDSVEAKCISTIDDLKGYAFICDNLFIDEFQFLSGHMSVILDLLNRGKNIYVAGLNLTAERKPFGLMPELMCLATHIEVMQGNCDICKKPNGIYTYCKEEKNEDILVGDAQYLCACNKCYLDKIAVKRCI